MSALKIGNVLRAGLMAWAMFMDLNVRSGDNYVSRSWGRAARWRWRRWCVFWR